MVKINSTPYSPTLETKGVDRGLETKIQSIGDNGGSLVDVSLRKVNSTTNQASRDQAIALESNLRREMGLSNLYFNVQEKYLQTISALKQIDENNQKIISKQMADSFNIQAVENIKLNTKQFYQDLKSKKDPNIDIFNESQNFLNEQIKGAVANAPNDEAVMGLYKDISAFKIETLGDAINDRQAIRQEFVTDSLSDAQNITTASLRMSGSVEDYMLAKNDFINQEGVLRGLGLDDGKVNDLKSKYMETITDSFLNGLLDKGQTEDVQKLLLDPEITSLLSKPTADKIINRGLALNKEAIDVRLDQINAADISHAYGKGESVKGMKDADKIVFEENKQVIGAFLSKIGEVGEATVAENLTQYFKERSGYFSETTAIMMTDKMLSTQNPKEAIVLASTVNKLANDYRTAKTLANLPENVKTKLIERSSILSRAINADINPVEAVEYLKQTEANKLDTSKSEAIKNLISFEVENLDTMTDVIDTFVWFGAKLEKDKSVFDNVFRQIGDNYVKDAEFVRMDNEYKKYFTDAMYRTNGNIEDSKTIAIKMMQTSNSVTSVNGGLEFWKYTPENLNLISTKERKDIFEKTLNTAKQTFAAESKNIGIRPIEGVTGVQRSAPNEHPFALVDLKTGNPIIKDGQYQYIVFNLTEAQMAEDKRNKQAYDTRKAAVDEANRSWGSLNRENLINSGQLEVGK